jgi:hypothetical protein
MKFQTQLLNSATFVGIDAHPDSHTAMAINRFQEQKGHLTFPNSKEGIKTFSTWLGKLETNTTQVIIGVEDGGNAGNALLSTILVTHQMLYEVNPLYTKHRRRPELTNWPSGTHKGTEQERSAGLPTEIRQIRVAATDRRFSGDHGKQMFAVIQNALTLTYEAAENPSQPHPGAAHGVCEISRARCAQTDPGATSAAVKSCTSFFVLATLATAVRRTRPVSA